jgi:adenosylmethionine-8-amino-7-oxononanoate aminotransferase
VTLLRGFLSPALFERGLICRADDRGDPVVQISPPLIAAQAQFDEMTGILGDVLTEAQERMHVTTRALAGEATREPGTRIP